MGSPKHALRLPDGRMMIEHVRQALAQVCVEVVTVGGQPVLPEVRNIEDSKAGMGPLAGLEALLATDPAHDYLVVPCDMPLITEEILRAMLTETGCSIVAIRVEGEEWIRSLPLRIATTVLPVIRARLERQELSLYGLLDEAGAYVLEIPSAWSAALANINTPEEFASLSRSVAH